MAANGKRELVYPDVLIVAPDGGGLNTVPEVDSISELGYRVRVLQGQVDDERLYRAVQDHRYDILHFACHGTLDCLGVSNGIRLSRNTLLQVARMSGARIAFLNACNSAQLGQVLVNAGLPVAIASLVEVPDDAARQTAQTFYSILAQTGDIEMAYRAACSGGDVYYAKLSNGGYALLQSKPVLAKLETMQAALEQSQADRGGLHVELGTLERSLLRLGRIVFGMVGLSLLTLLALAVHMLLR